MTFGLEYVIINTKGIKFPLVNFWKFSLGKETLMAATATPYTKQGTLALPRVHIPTWYGSVDVSEHNDAKLNFNVISQFTVTQAETGTDNYVDDSIDYRITIPDGTNSSNTTTKKQDNITIGTTVPVLGYVRAYSDDDGTPLSGGKTAHVFYLEHAAVKSFNFKIPHNHVIDRIEKLYRATTGTTNQNLSTISAATDANSQKLVINATYEADATVSGVKLTLIEGGH